MSDDPTLDDTPSIPLPKRRGGKPGGGADDGAGGAPAVDISPGYAPTVVPGARTKLPSGLELQTF